MPQVAKVSDDCNPHVRGDLATQPLMHLQSQWQLQRQVEELQALQRFLKLQQLAQQNQCSDLQPPCTQFPRYHSVQPDVTSWQAGYAMGLAAAGEAAGSSPDSWPQAVPLPRQPLHVEGFQCLPANLLRDAEEDLGHDLVKAPCQAMWGR